VWLTTRVGGAVVELYHSRLLFFRAFCFSALSAYFKLVLIMTTPYASFGTFLLMIHQTYANVFLTVLKVQERMHYSRAVTPRNCPKDKFSHGFVSQPDLYFIMRVVHQVLLSPNIDELAKILYFCIYVLLKMVKS
jgi:hypothetical protein